MNNKQFKELDDDESSNVIRFDQVWLVQSFTEPEKEYKVQHARNHDAAYPYVCECLSWRFGRNKHRGYCKHVVAITEAMGEGKLGRTSEYAGRIVEHKIFRIITIPDGVENVRAYSLLQALKA